MNKKALSVLLVIIVLVVCITTPFVLTACSKKAKVAVVDYKLTSEEYAFCVNYGNVKTLSDINNFLIEIKSNGTFNRIVAKYYGKGTPQGVKSAPEGTENAIVVVTCADYPPFEYIEGDYYYGVDMEIISAYAKRMGKKLVIKNVAFEALFYEIQMNHADIAVSAISVVESRKGIIAYSNSYYNLGQVVMTRAGDSTFASCSSAEDVKNMLAGMSADIRFGYQNGSTAYYYLFAKSNEFTMSYSVSGKGYDSIDDAIEALISGEVDYVMLDSTVANTIAARYNGKKK